MISAEEGLAWPCGSESSERSEVRGQRGTHAVFSAVVRSRNATQTQLLSPWYATVLDSTTPDMDGQAGRQTDRQIDRQTDPSVLAGMYGCALDSIIPR